MIEYVIILQVSVSPRSLTKAQYVSPLPVSPTSFKREKMRNHEQRRSTGSTIQNNKSVMSRGSVILKPRTRIRIMHHEKISTCIEIGSIQGDR